MGDSAVKDVKILKLLRELRCEQESERKRKLCWGTTKVRREEEHAEGDGEIEKGERRRERG